MLNQMLKCVDLFYKDILKGKKFGGYKIVPGDHNVSVKFRLTNNLDKLNDYEIIIQPVEADKIRNLPKDSALNLLSDIIISVVKFESNHLDRYIKV